MLKFVLAIAVAVMFIVGVAYSQANETRVRIDVEHERVTGTGDGWRNIVTYIKVGEEWKDTYWGFPEDFLFRVRSNFLDYLHFEAPIEQNGTIVTDHYGWFIGRQQIVFVRP